MQMHDGGARLRGADSCFGSISLAVTGRLGDIDGVWIEPVTAHVMMILLAFAISHPRKPWSTVADLADQIERECAFTSPVELIHDSIILQHSILNVTKQRINRDAKTSGCNQSATCLSRRVHAGIPGRTALTKSDRTKAHADSGLSMI